MSKIEVNAIEPQCGTTLTIGASDTSIAGIGTVNWDTTAKTAAFTAVSGRGYFVNTTSSAFTATLPSGVAGAIVSLADYAATWQTNNLTVSPQSGEKIGGESANVILNTEGQSVTFVYVDSTQGWINVQDSTSNERANPYIIATGGTITTCGNDKIHTFTGPGTFCVSQIATCSANNQVSYMVVAGGGGGASLNTGGTCQGQGAGGAGGFREDKSPVTPYTASPLEGAGSITVTATSFPITVGGGGAGHNNNPTEGPGTSGSNSVFSTITSAGGGGGSGGCAPVQVQGNGGSGGGAARYGGSPGTNPEAAGVGNTPPVSPPQGNPGGQGFFAGSTLGAGGGGGGAGGAGSTNTPSCHPGNGGVGVTTSISSSSLAYAGGGASQNGGTSPCGTGGCAPGGNGGNGTTNRGGGGAGGSGAPGYFSGGSGGSGVVIIRYKYQ